MNYNANTGGKQPFGRKVKRVSDVNSMGYSPFEQGDNQQPVYQNVPNTNPYVQDFNNQQQGFNQNYGAPSPQPQQGFQYPQQQQQQQFQNQIPGGMPKLDVFGQPILQDITMQYGQQLVDAGSTRIKQEVERYLPVTKLKYYFAVDTSYVLHKLVLLFFPFTHKDWSIKYEEDGQPVQPRFEINAPDLYIPSMAYVTYVLIAGIVMGLQDRFTPEQIGILASSALAWCVVELVIYSCTLYVIQVETRLKTFDLLAYSGYKFVGTILSIAVYLVGGKTGYYASLVYANFALAFFLVRTLKAQVLSENNTEPNYYGQQSVALAGSKRRLYFLLFVACVQPVLSWWLSFHLLSSSPVVPAT